MTATLQYIQQVRVHFKEVPVAYQVGGGEWPQLPAGPETEQKCRQVGPISSHTKIYR